MSCIHPSSCTVLGLGRVLVQPMKARVLPACFAAGQLAQTTAGAEGSLARFCCLDVLVAGCSGFCGVALWTGTSRQAGSHRGSPGRCVWEACPVCQAGFLQCEDGLWGRCQDCSPVEAAAFCVAQSDGAVCMADSGGAFELTRLVPWKCTLWLLGYPLSAVRQRPRGQGFMLCCAAGGRYLPARLPAGLPALWLAAHTNCHAKPHPCSCAADWASSTPDIATMRRPHCYLYYGGIASLPCQLAPQTQCCYAACAAQFACKLFHADASKLSRSLCCHVLMSLLSV